MNPNNKITNPLPTKTAPNKNPYDRIQSAPPEGKEEDKKKDIQIKEAFKMNQAKVYKKKYKLPKNENYNLILFFFRK